MIQITETEDRQTCYALRQEVFVQEQGYTAEGEVDDLDAISHHLLAVEDDEPVATARVYIDGTTAKIGRVCVITSRRGIGLGADIINAAVALAAQKRAKHVVLGAQVHAIGFYEKLGFTPFDPPYDDEGQPHQMMKQAL
ncbi:GNAT family N-acetyltransferase [uncultured Sulfitobacter sp.]|uniref:GNAT family N-acetyltransferase n=1 Tax=uncultured Sulfitobacter sp. TaxID=191468 RepID=UPI0026210A9F|nr:GNAT family N-acetyltransferase [uncultured Sulfitobacter sp.]